MVFRLSPEKNIKALVYLYANASVLDLLQKGNFSVFITVKNNISEMFSVSSDFSLLLLLSEDSSSFADWIAALGWSTYPLCWEQNKKKEKLTLLKITESFWTCLRQNLNICDDITAHLMIFDSNSACVDAENTSINNSWLTKTSLLSFLLWILQVCVASVTWTGTLVSNSVVLNINTAGGYQW